MSLTPAADPPLQLVDRSRLVPGRDVVGLDDERRDGALQVVHHSHTTSVRRASDSLPRAKHANAWLRHSRHCGAVPQPRDRVVVAGPAVAELSREVGAGGHPGTASRSARHPGRHHVLDPVAVRPVGLEQLGQPLVVERLAGQRVAHVGGDVVVPEAHRVGMAVRALADLGRRPDPDTGQRAEPAVGLVRRQVEGALERPGHLRRAHDRVRPLRVDVAAQPLPGRDHGDRRRAGQRAHPSPGTRARAPVDPKRRSSSRHPRQAS